MPKKEKKSPQKSSKKTLLDQVEVRITESLMDLPKKVSEKKYRKKVLKAGKILTNSLATKPVKAVSKADLKKSGKKKSKPVPEVKTEAAS